MGGAVTPPTGNSDCREGSVQGPWQAEAMMKKRELIWGTAWEGNSTREECRLKLQACHTWRKEGWREVCAEELGIAGGSQEADGLVGSPMQRLP